MELSTFREEFVKLHGGFMSRLRVHLLFFIALTCQATWAGGQEYESELLRASHAQVEEGTRVGPVASLSLFRDRLRAQASTSLGAFLMWPEDILTPMDDANLSIDGTSEAMNSAPQDGAPPPQ